LLLFLHVFHFYLEIGRREFDRIRVLDIIHLLLNQLLTSQQPLFLFEIDILLNDMVSVPLLVVKQLFELVEDGRVSKGSEHGSGDDPDLDHGSRREDREIINWIFEEKDALPDYRALV
jgi:hypothetical protein